MYVLLFKLFIYVCYTLVCCCIFFPLFELVQTSLMFWDYSSSFLLMFVASKETLQKKLISL